MARIRFELGLPRPMKTRRMINRRCISVTAQKTGWLYQFRTGVLEIE